MITLPVSLTCDNTDSATGENLRNRGAGHRCLRSGEWNRKPINANNSVLARPGARR